MDDSVRIVVVDDMPDAATMLQELLSTVGYEVRIAHNGADALHIAAFWQPDAVLLDIRMPGLNGLELARELRSLYGNDMVLIAITGAEEDDPLVKKTFACVDHHLQKPDYLPGLMQIFTLLRARPNQPQAAAGRSTHPKATGAALTSRTPSADET